MAAIRRTKAGPLRRSWFKAALLMLVGLAVLGLGAAWFAYERVGRTPGELMDYAERRLSGHNKLEAVALPVMGVLRSWLDEPGLAERRLQRFVVPAPPDGVDAAPATLADVPGQRVWRVGPYAQVRTIAEAARLARDGDVVEIQAGVYRGDVAVWLQRRLTIRAVGGRVRLIADGRSAEGKGIWVIRNGEFDVSGIDFVGARVADRNGAGIRFEGGTLRVSDCLFWGNENGMLSTGAPTAVLEIRNSEFGYNGAGDGLSHNLYVGQIARLSVSGSYFHHANVGHLLKSRAAVNEVIYTRLSDEPGGRASYELDFPNGGEVLVMGNVVQQSRTTENSSMLAYGMEGLTHARNRLVVVSNTFVNDQPYGGTFVRATDGTESVVVANNLLAGRGGLSLAGEQQVQNNPRVEWSSFAQAVRQDYRLVPAQQLAYQAVTPAAAEPHSEYLHPRQVRRLQGPPALVGALQSPP